MSAGIVLIAIALAYGLGTLERQIRPTGYRLPRPMRALAMSGGLFVIYVALVSPLDELADHLLSAHMVQHLLLMLLAAPLLVLARPMPVLIRSAPLPIRKAAARFWHQCGLSAALHALARPAASWIVFCGTVILWHVPAVYRWAVGNEFRHSLMHLSFLGSALLFWSVVLERVDRRRLSYAGSALYVFSAALLTGLPGALIAFAQQTLYVSEPYPPLPLGITVLADQQLAGLLMWIPMDLTLFGVALALFAAALGAGRPGRKPGTVTTCSPLRPLEELKNEPRTPRNMGP